MLKSNKFFAPFIFEGETFVAKLTVHEFEGNGNRIYSVESIDIKKSSGTLTPREQGAQADITDWTSNSRIQQLIESVKENSVSKVVGKQ